MGIIAKLIYGSDELDIDDGSTYGVMTDSGPPSPARAINLASGTFRNKRGSRRAGAQPKDRVWSFSVKCLGASNAETHQAASRLQAFLDRCADTSQKLYLEYAPSDAVSYRPTYGQSVYRYEIKDAWCNAWDRYSAALNTQAIVVTVNALIGPHAVGLKQRVGAAMGGVYENNRLATDGYSTGLVIPEATTNRVTNPIAYSATTNWTASGAGVTVTRLTSGGPLGIADTCIEAYLADVASAGVLINETNRMSVTAGTPWTFSVYAKHVSGSSYGATLRIQWYNAGAAVISTSISGTQTFTGDWARYDYTDTAPVGAVTALCAIIRVTTGVQVVRLCAAQMESQTYASSFFHGSMLGCSWSSTTHASAQTRVAARWRLPGTTGEFTPGQGTAAIAWTPSRASTAADNNLRILDTTGSTLRLIWEDGN